MNTPWPKITTNDDGTYSVTIGEDVITGPFTTMEEAEASHENVEAGVELALGS